MDKKYMIKLQSMLSNLGISAFAILLSLIFSALIMLAVGYNPVAAYSSMLNGSFGSTQAIANTLSKSIPLIFCGLSFSFAAKSGVFNIGGEGQLNMGALASAVVALSMQGMPRIIVLTASILAGFLAGGLLGVLLGLAKSKLHLNEVIVAIMMNYLVALFCSYAVSGPLKYEGSVTPQTEAMDKIYMFRNLIPKSQLTTALLLALLLALIIYLFFAKTRAGFNIRVVGQNPDAAQASGIKVGAMMVIAMAVSGGIAGLGGMTEVFGKYGRFIDGFSPGFGFTGIAVAVLAANNPFGLIITAILFGAMDAGAMKMSYVAGISANMVQVIQGMVILFVATPNIARKILYRKEAK